MPDPTPVVDSLPATLPFPATQPATQPAVQAVASQEAEWRAADELLKTRAGRDQLQTTAWKRAAAVVAAAVHDQRLPEALRGPDVSFDAKAQQLDALVQTWAGQLTASGEQPLVKLSRRLVRCQPYSNPVHHDQPSEETRKTPCGSLICPHCYARRVEEHYWLLRSCEPRVLGVVAYWKNVLSNSLPVLRFELAAYQRRLKYMTQHTPAAIVRTTLVPVNPAAVCFPYWIGTFALFPAAGKELQVPPDFGREGYKFAAFDVSEKNYGHVAARWMNYQPWLMAEETIPHLSLLLAAMRGRREYTWSERLDIKQYERRFVALGGPLPPPITDPVAVI